MKILILNWRDIQHPLSGGAEISLFEHAKYWAKKGNEVIWFASAYKNSRGEEIINGIKYIRKGSHFTVHIWAYIFFLNNKFGKPDVVIDSFHFLPFFTPLYISKRKIVGLINEVAGKVWFENLPYLFAWIGYHVEPFFFKLYKKVAFITGSESARDDLKKVGIKLRDINVVHHGIKGITVGKYIRKERTPVLVFLGRVSADKGIKDVLSIFLKVSETFKNSELWIIGKEEREGFMTELLGSISKKVKKNIKYFGFVDEKTKFLLLKKSWILIHPSKKEGWGLNVIEAGIVGTPTVGYNVEGLRDSVQHNKTGILVRPERPDLLADAAIKLITDKGVYKKISNNAVKWAEQFRWETSVKKSWEIIKNQYEKNKK